MANGILIMGDSGAGKTTSLRNLPPDETFFVDSDGKGMPWRGWRNQYNKEKKNYAKTDDPSKVGELMQNVNDKGNGIHYLVIDTLNACMVGDEMRRMREKG